MAAIEKLGKTPLLALGMRLGEGTGRLSPQVSSSRLRQCHSGMATFSQAGVSRQRSEVRSVRLDGNRKFRRRPASS
jgi:nicotinate-nucleotide--dimethylbenzimidazole phosphoribosyltransferase